MLGLFIYGTSIFLMIFPTKAWWFYLIRMAQGFGSACLFVPTESAINVLSSPEKRGTNMGLYATVFALGMALGPPIGAWLYEVNRVIPFISCFIVSLISIVIIWVGFEDTHVYKKSSYLGLKELAGVIKIPLLAALCYAIVEVSVIGFLSLYLKELHITSTALGFIFTLFGIGGIISPYPVGKAADRFGKVNLLCILGGLLVLVTFSFNFISSYLGIAFLIFGVGIVAGGLYPISLSLIADLIPADKMGSGNAAFSLSFGVGCILGPLATGWVMDLMGISHLFYPMTAAALIFLSFAIADAKNRRAQSKRV
jgi:MFS family permease